MYFLEKTKLTSFATEVQLCLECKRKIEDLQYIPESILCVDSVVHRCPVVLHNQLLHLNFPFNYISATIMS